MKWNNCEDGRIPEVLDLLHYFLFPHSPDVPPLNTSLELCHYPSVYNLPTLWGILPEESDLFLPKELVDTLVALFVVSIPVTLCLVLARYTWDYIDPYYFGAISPSHKKWYVVANLSKAFFLACMALHTKYLTELFRMFSDDYGAVFTKRSVALYVVTDVVALLLVPKLPRSTIIHHVVTLFLGCVGWGTNLQMKGYHGILSVAKMSLSYGMICCISFLVNAYLALRVVYPSKSNAIKVLCFTSLISYFICCGVNWTYQIYWVINLILVGEFSLYAGVYILLMFSIVNDDIVLIKWLLRQNSPMGTPDSKKEYFKF